MIIFELYNPDTNTHIKIYNNGKVEGFNGVSINKLYNMLNPNEAVNYLKNHDNLGIKE